MIVTFTNNYKKYTQLYGKNWTTDYLLFVNKIIRDKVESNFIVPNERQKFIVNYEIKKLIHKAINTRNNKYNNIVYVYSHIKSASINNLMGFLIENYPELNFDILLIDLDSIEINDEVYNKLSSVTRKNLNDNEEEEDTK